MFSEEKRKEILAITKKWVETIIIGLNLCPFAKAPFLKNAVRFSLKDATTMKGFLELFAKEIDFLNKNPQTETTLLILPTLDDAKLFHQFFLHCEEMIILNKWIKKYQIVSFHPYARFEGIPTDSPLNLVGIAPYPILHILRVKSVESLGAAVKKDVQLENNKRLQAMTKEEIEALWKKIME